MGVAPNRSRGVCYARPGCAKKPGHSGTAEEEASCSVLSRRQHSSLTAARGRSTLFVWPRRSPCANEHVEVFLMGDAVHAARAGQDPRGGHASLEQMLLGLLEQELST